MLIRQVNAKVASTSTIVETFLFPFYKFAIETQLEFLKQFKMGAKTTPLMV